MENQISFTVDKDNLSVITSRVFNASREMLWKVLTDPTRVSQWWGPAMYKTTVESMDLKVGGKWRYISTDEKGEESGFHGEYLEIDEPNKITDTFEWDGMPGHFLTETLVLEDMGDGKTKYTSTAVYQNLEDLEGMVNMGMESGNRETIERLAKIVEG